MQLTPLVTGAGLPVTVFAHGLGASVAETRPLGSGVPGTRVFAQARGHGAAPLPETPGYGELAADLVALADSCAATQALGVSMGAGTLLRLLSQHPDRFERLVLFLPAAVDAPRHDHAVQRVAGLAAALTAGDREAVVDPGDREAVVDAGDRAAVVSLVRAELPADLTGTAVESYVQARVDFLLASPGLPALITALADDRPVPDRTLLASVSADVLLLAQEGDPLHPASVARELAAVLPRARLVVFDRPGAVFRERPRLRELVSTHLGA